MHAPVCAWAHASHLLSKVIFLVSSEMSVLSSCSFEKKCLLCAFAIRMPFPNLSMHVQVLTHVHHLGCQVKVRRCYYKKY